VQGVLSHSAKLACSYCSMTGQTIEGRMCFPFNIYPSRSNECYIALEENNQVTASPLLGLVDFVQDFPPEYMHSVCHGVVKRMCQLFFSTIKGIRLPCKLSSAQKDRMSALLTQLSGYFPCDFTHKVRSLDELENYKAIEYRTIIVYLVPLVFADFLPANFFEHLMLLHFSMYCFVSKVYSKTLFAQAKACILKFCQDATTLYNHKLETFNSHLLTHLPHFVEELGPLDA
jgi:hypothetical protein